jgi:4-phospho-D-threonate 3-dehydrogenase / 4-phospho-D-erythronate 3-dehydrogenase
MTDAPLIVGVTMGDPAGVGPELTAALLSGCCNDPQVLPVLIGNAVAMRYALGIRGLDARLNVMTEYDRGKLVTQAINVYDPGELDVSEVPIGELSEIAGEASMLYNRQGTELAMEGGIDALVTSPVTKASAKLAGYDYPGQAEYFAELAGKVPFSTILIYKNFRAALLTTHLPLIDACRKVTKDTLLAKIRFLHSRRLELGFPHLRLAVAALNPHAGESGTMGREEIDEIEPAIAAARAEGISADGPFPVNALISPPYDGRNYDLTLALYHDQVVARMNMHETTTLTFGLPFIRTSVGHGSALDIAGKGVADPCALAITYNHTVTLARARRHAKGLSW